MTDFPALLSRYREDLHSVHQTWFLTEDRLKSFRTVRRGVQQVVEDIQRGVFPNDFKGSSLEVVMTAITEQKQVFQGAAHAFYWKPKLRIPDIYENRQHQLAFMRFLQGAMKASSEAEVLKEIGVLSQVGIKGLGPAAANILYFLHPTLIPAFNTAILKGFNLLTGSKLKLGSWADFLLMRQGMLRLLQEHKNLSRDLGELSGLLFEIGTGRLLVEGNVDVAWQQEQQKAEQKRSREVDLDVREENLHSRMQAHLLKIGRALGYRVWVARNDRSRPNCHGGTLGEGTEKDLSGLSLPADVLGTVELIDVLWLSQDSVACAFEVEKSTSIYSGILRLQDLSLTLQGHPHLYLVAPDDREREVEAQLKRPSFQGLQNKPHLLTFSRLEGDCDHLCRFGESREVLRRIARAF